MYLCHNPSILQDQTYSPERMSSKSQILLSAKEAVSLWVLGARKVGSGSAVLTGDRSLSDTYMAFINLITLFFTSCWSADSNGDPLYLNIVFQELHISLIIQHLFIYVIILVMEAGNYILFLYPFPNNWQRTRAGRELNGAWRK